MPLNERKKKENRIKILSPENLLDKPPYKKRCLPPPTDTHTQTMMLGACEKTVFLGSVIETTVMC